MLSFFLACFISRVHKIFLVLFFLLYFSSLIVQLFRSLFFHSPLMCSSFIIRYHSSRFSCPLRSFFVFTLFLSLLLFLFISSLYPLYHVVILHSYFSNLPIIPIIRLYILFLSVLIRSAFPSFLPLPPCNYLYLPYTLDILFFTNSLLLALYINFPVRHFLTSNSIPCFL